MTTASSPLASAAAAPGDRITWLRVSSCYLPLAQPISDAKVLTGRQKPMTEIAMLFVEVQTAQGQMKSLADALNQYRLDSGNYPDETLGLNALTTRPANAGNWQGPYLKSLPPDPWGNPYLFKNPGTPPNDAEIISLGRDGKAVMPIPW